MIFGIKVKELREALGMSQAELARASGVSQPVIASIEKGKQRTARNLPKIAGALGVHISDLDPNYPIGTLRTLSLEHAAVAYEVMMGFLRRDLTPEKHQALARLFLELAQVRLDDKIGGSLGAQMRLRVEFLMQSYLQ